MHFVQYEQCKFEKLYERIYCGSTGGKSDNFQAQTLQIRPNKFQA